VPQAALERGLAGQPEFVSTPFINFGLEKLIALLRSRAASILHRLSLHSLPEWYGFLAKRSPFLRLLSDRCCGCSPAAAELRAIGLIQPQGRELALLGRVLTG